MSYSCHDLFPVRFYKGFIQDPLSVLNEIKSKEVEISTISEATQLKDVTQYATDYANPVKINSFEKEIELFLNGLVQDQGFKSITMPQYWTAIYKGPQGMHAPHTHRSGNMDMINYSGVLYLSNHDGTTFYRPHGACHNSQIDNPAVLGNVVLFPSEIVHGYAPKITDNKNTRYIMSFNLSISA